MKSRVKFMFKWYDLWIGVFIDTRNKYIYILPFFMCVIRIYYGPRCFYCKMMEPAVISKDGKPMCIDCLTFEIDWEKVQREVEEAQ